MPEKVKSQRLKDPTAAEYVKMQRTLTRVQEYVYLGLSSGNMKGRNDAIEEGNSVKFAYMQGALDVCQDIRNILDGMMLTITVENSAPAKPNPNIR